MHVKKSFKAAKLGGSDIDNPPEVVVNTPDVVEKSPEVAGNRNRVGSTETSPLLVASSQV